MTSYGAKIASIPDSLERLLDLYDEGQLPPCLLYTSPSPRDYAASRMPSSA